MTDTEKESLVYRVKLVQKGAKRTKENLHG
jgi:hypothetical protein